MQLQLAGTKPEVLGEPKTWFNGVRFHTLAQSVLETVETKEHPKDKKLEKFPIDGHRDEICAHVRNNRITIIHGETGCGKSSRVPQMLVEDLGPKNVRMYISQPRRIAATSLKKRVGKELTKIYAGKDVGEDFVGLRMGHGVRDESPGTRIWFCTAGYLVRIAAHHPETFHNHSHLIIDEIPAASSHFDECNVGGRYILCIFQLKFQATVCWATQVQTHRILPGRRCARQRQITDAQQGAGEEGQRDYCFHG